MEDIIIPLGHLFSYEIGTQDEATFMLKQKDRPLADDVISIGELAGEVHMTNMGDFVLVQLTNMDATLATPCYRCDGTAIVVLEHGETGEREFYKHSPEIYKNELINDIFFIDSGTNSINISEMLRQEILLQLPLRPLCDNIHQDTTPEDTEGTFKPFEGLKDMMRE